MHVTFEPIGIFKWGFRHYCHDNNRNLKYFKDVLTVSALDMLLLESGRGVLGIFQFPVKFFEKVNY